MSIEPYRSKPKMKPVRQSNGKVRWSQCQHMLYINGKTETCGAATKNGKSRCDKCRERESPRLGQQWHDRIVNVR